jgi:hypothetical protein
MITARANGSEPALASRSSRPSVTPRADPAVCTWSRPGSVRRVRQARSVEMQESTARENVQPKSGSAPRTSAITPGSISVWALRNPITTPSAPTER